MQEDLPATNLLLSQILNSNFNKWKNLKEVQFEPVQTGFMLFH